MSKTLSTLIRLNQFHVDEKRRALKELQEQEDATRQAIADLETAMVREGEAAGGNADMLRDHAAFVQGAKFKISQFEQFLEHLQPQLDQARDELAEAFEELKKAEITKDRRDEADRKEQNRLEQQELDELGMLRHRRRQQEQE